MHKRITTNGAGNWIPFDLPGFLHSCNIQNVGSADVYIAVQENQPDTDYWTMNPGDIKEYEAEDTSAENPNKKHTTKIWYMDDGATATTFEIDYTCKGRGK